MESAPTRTKREAQVYELHFEVVSKVRLIEASILLANGDVAMMERLTKSQTRERIQSLATVIRILREVSSSGTMFILQRPPPVRAVTARSPVAGEKADIAGMERILEHWRDLG
jgi:hypothetical protein